MFNAYITTQYDTNIKPYVPFLDSFQIFYNLIQAALPIWNKNCTFPDKLSMYIRQSRFVPRNVLISLKLQNIEQVK